MSGKSNAEFISVNVGLYNKYWTLPRQRDIFMDEPVNLVPTQSLSYALIHFGFVSDTGEALKAVLNSEQPFKEVPDLTVCRIPLENKNRVLVVFIWEPSEQ